MFCLGNVIEQTEFKKSNLTKIGILTQGKCLCFLSWHGFHSQVSQCYGGDTFCVRLAGHALNHIMECGAILSPVGKEFSVSIWDRGLLSIVRNSSSY